MQPPFPAPVPEWHNDTYPSISPSNPSIASATAGKTVIVTGGGAGIGRGIAQAYAEAGATHVALLGRTEKTLNETKQIIEKDTKGAKVTVHIADVADEESVKRAAESIGGWDVLILNAGIAAKSGNLGEANIQDWWRVYEVCLFSLSKWNSSTCNRHFFLLALACALKIDLTRCVQTNVRGILVCTQAFLPTRKPSASILGINAGLIQIPSGIGPCAGQSAYSSSKVAQLRMLEFLAVEEPDIYVASVHPGVVDTHMSAEWSENIEYGKNGMPPLDNGEYLPPIL